MWQPFVAFLKLYGEKMENKEYTEGIAINENKFLKWFDNYWYHYKWHTIATLFIVIVLGVCIIQSCTTAKNDIIFTYAGPKEFVTAPDEKISLNTALSAAATEQYGDNASATVNSFLIYSAEQIKEIESELDSEGKQKYKVDTAFNTQELNGFDEFSRSGASFILLLDPFVYNRLLNNSGESERLVPLHTLYGQTPEGANDQYSVRLGDTEIYQNTPELRVLPADTVVCLHAKLILATKQKDYDKQMQTFKSFAKLGKLETQNTDPISE